MKNSIAHQQANNYNKTNGKESSKIAEAISLPLIKKSRFFKFLKDKRYRYGYPEFAETISEISYLIYGESKIVNDTDYLDYTTLLQIIELSQKAPDKDQPLKREIADFVFDNLRANINSFTNKQILNLIKEIATNNQGNFIIYNIIKPEFNIVSKKEFKMIIISLIQNHDATYNVYMNLKSLKSKIGSWLETITGKTYEDLNNLNFYEFKKLIISSIK